MGIGWILKLFEELELRLVASLRRNLAKHKAWEREEGSAWEAWQSAKLRDLRQYRQDNKKILDEIFPEIQAESGDLLLQEYEAGQVQAQEDIQKLLEEQEQEGGSHGFFELNNRKMEALLRESQDAQQKVEKACLRYMDDVYRRTILKASTALASGTMTVRQATDWAVKDFLEQGITSIQYKNGRRVNIATWAEMALRTNSTRAKLLGEAQKRQEMGIDTVLVSQYGACSETCLPWQGRVYIDDVFGVFGGETRGDLGHSRNGKWYPLLSVAVAAGLFHPNCRHTLTTWIEGVSKMPKPLDTQKVQQAAKLEEQQRALERKVRKAKRLQAGLQNPEDAKKAQAQVREAQKELREFVRAHPDVLRRDPWRERNYPDTLAISQKQSILKDVNTSPLRISDTVIEQMDGIESGVLTESANKKFKATQKSLLTYLKDDMPEREAVITLDMQGNELMRYKDSRSMMASASEVFQEHISIHNHPSGQIFSLDDISVFSMDEYMKILCVVGNDGSTYIAEKTEDFSFSDLYSQLQRAVQDEPDYVMEPEKYVSFMETFLKEAEKSGIRYRKRNSPL